MAPRASTTASRRETDRQRSRWRLIVDHLPIFAGAWLGTLALWMALYALQERFVYALAWAVLGGIILASLVADLLRRSLEARLAGSGSEARFRGVFDHAPMGMAIATIEGEFVQVNRSFHEMLGYEEPELLGKTIAELTHPDDVAESVASIGKLVAGEIESFVIEKRYLHKDGHVVIGFVSSSLVRDLARAPLYLVAQIQDVTERKHADDALRASEGRYRGLVESHHDLIARSDPEGRLTFANDAYCEALGLRREDVEGGRVAFPDLIHPDDLAGVTESMQALFQPPYRILVVNRNRTPEGWRWFEWETCGIRDEAGAVIELQAAGRDVTERRVAEEQLRASLARLHRSEEKLRALALRQVSIREEERKRLGLDLHDDVCQELVGVGIHLASLRQRLGPMSTENAATFDRVARYLDALVEHLRVLARDLQPLPLRDYGLVDGLRSLVSGMSSESSSVSAVFPTDIPRLGENTEVAVYRFAQEAVINAVRHSDASSIDLVLAVEDGVLRLEVCDDGRGFDPEQCSDALGLVSMEERVIALGGKFTLRSAPGAGTTVGMVCPIGAPAEIPPATRRAVGRGR